MDTLSVFSSTGPPSHDLAFEAELLARAADGQISMLVASWPGPVVILGYAQPPDDVDLQWCRDRKVPVLRRLSGGTGVIHRGDLSVSLAVPKDHPWAAGIVGLYGHFLDVVQPALEDLGSPVERVNQARHATRVRSPICFEDQLADTLVIDGRKAVGCSQARRMGGVLVHAAILLALDASIYGRVFGVDEERVADGLAPVSGGAEWRSVAEVVVRRFGRALELEPSWEKRPIPEPESMAPYGLKRWAPVPDDGIRPSEAELV